MRISLWKFWGGLCLYSILSITLFSFTSQGWTAGLLILPAAGVFYGTIVILSLVITIVFHINGAREVRLSKTALLLVLCLQTIATLLNPGDCGDNAGGGPFFARLLFSREVICSTTPPYNTAFFVVIIVSVFAILALVSLWAIARVYWNAHRQGNSSVRIFLISFYSFLSVILIGSIIWGTWLMVGQNYRNEISFLEIDSQGSYSKCRVTRSDFDPTEYCKFLLTKYGYTYIHDESGTYALNGRNFSILDFFKVVVRGRE